MSLKFATKTMVILAIIAACLSFAKFDHCRNAGWGSPDVYVHACYSDLPALYGDRGMNQHAWPYSSATDSVEYPPGTAMVMWVTSWLVPHPASGYKSYFDINALLIALLFIFTAVLLAKMNAKMWYLLAVSPAVLASLYINWDIWAVFPALGAIYLFDKEKYEKSALLLGLSIATKFFPIVILIPIALIFYRRRDFASLIRYGALTVGTWLLLNLPFMVTTTAGWWRFFKLNSERGADFGSLWYSLQLYGINFRSVNFLAIVAFLFGVAGFALYFLLLKRIPSLAELSFLIVVVFTASSKVYSPQYVIWLTPLAILAVRRMELRRDFWIWQAGELIYHVAIWEYLASYTGAKFGLTAKLYAFSILIRLATTFWLSGRLIQSSFRGEPAGDSEPAEELSALSTEDSEPQEVEFPASAEQG